MRGTHNPEVLHQIIMTQRQYQDTPAHALEMMATLYKRDVQLNHLPDRFERFIKYMAAIYELRWRRYMTQRILVGSMYDVSDNPKYFPVSISLEVTL